MLPIRSALLSLLAIAGCVTPGDGDTDPVSAPRLDPGDDPGETGDGQDGEIPPYDGDPSSVCKHITVTGKVFYNDLRRHGRFADRKNPFNQPGTRDEFATSTDKQNYLGLLDAKVSLYEADDLSSTDDDDDCALTQFAGSTYIAEDGSWSWTGTICDACRTDTDGAADNGISIAAKITLARCDDPDTRCFSVDDPAGEGYYNHYTDLTDWGAPYYRWYHNATATIPVGVHGATTVDLGVDYFQRTYGLTAGSSTDTEAQAANLYATMVDVTRRVHLDENLPFDHARWGQIRAFYPNPTGGGIAHSHQADRLCVTQPATWIDGDEGAHEYGHLTHYWVWDGFGKYGALDFDSDGDGATSDDTSESYSGREYAITAFKEAWAEFIRRVTFEGANVGLSCASIETRTPLAPSATLYDGSLLCPANASTCIQGRYIVADVEQTLCDLWDPVEPQLFNVNDDRLQISLVDLQENLSTVYFEASSDERNDVATANDFYGAAAATAPLGLCRFAQKLVENGTSSLSVAETLGRNLIECPL